MALVTVEVDLSEFDTEDLEDELAGRGDVAPLTGAGASERGGETPVGKALWILQAAKCPEELLAPIRQWAQGRLSLAALRELVGI